MIISIIALIYVCTQFQSGSAAIRHSQYNLHIEMKLIAYIGHKNIM